MRSILKKRVIFFGMLFVLLMVTLAGCTKGSLQITKAQFTPAGFPATAYDAQAAIDNYLQSPTGNNFSNIKPTVQEAPLIIPGDTTDTQTVQVNLVEISGTVPSLNTQVTVNYLPATINSDRTYYAFVDLMEGYNTVVITTSRGKDIQTKSFTLYFEPPLAVNLDMPKFSPETDYRITPLTITGEVNQRLAQVYIEGKPVKVLPNGYFSADVLAHYFTALAQYKNQIDTDHLPLFIDNGSIMPGSTIAIPLFMLGSHEIKLKAGESATVDWTLNTRKEFAGVPKIKINIGLAGNNNIQRITSPIPQGFKITPIPSNFTLYPNIKYHIGFYIETKADLTPGTYNFLVTLSAGSTSGEQNITVTVE